MSAASDKGPRRAPVDPVRKACFEDNRFVAAGDAQRVWFPEMVERLRDQWESDTPFGALISLRDDLDAILQRIRSSRNIDPPVFRCPYCGHVGPGAMPHVSVRAMILSLSRFGIAPPDQAHDIEKRWAAYRKQNSLDIYGKQTALKPVGNGGCTHT
jgi:hypothetical protein